jgi:hypothetical protein
MSLSPSVLSALIKSNLESYGASGYNLQKFCDGVAQGILTPIIGTTFVTNDTGLISSPGTGAGVGITGLSPSSMVSSAIADMFRTGYNANKLMQAIMDATVTHLSTSATLTSSDTQVYSGTGLIVIGSIVVTVSGMSSSIDSSLASQGAHGANRTHLSHAIATGIVTNILSSGTGTLTITGSPGPPFTPGTDTGAGVIT